MFESSPAVQEFIAAATRYCEWAVATPREAYEEMRQAQRLLAELHHRALQLPDVEPDSEDTPDIEIDSKDAQKHFVALPVDEYWSVSDPTEKEERVAIYHSLTNDLVEIYEDLMEGLELCRRDQLQDAVWGWKFGFDTHWGRHLVSAQHAIHNYLG